MAKCRIQNIKPPCGYVVEGVDEVRLLDFDDLYALRFNGDDLYSNCLVTAILRYGDFTDLPASDGAKYSSTFNNKIYTHTLETFVGDLAADLASNLHLGTKRRYVPVFRLKTGRYFTFGYEAGAILSYVNQTAEAVGSLVTITAQSIYPLFEVSGEALTASYGVEFEPDVINGAYCEVKP